MKRTLIFISIIAMSIFLSNCTKEKIQSDLTIEITGIYKGIFTSEEYGKINPYELTVSKISKTKIKVSTEKEIEFDNTEFEIMPFNDNEKILFSTTEGNSHLVEFVEFIVTDSITTIRLEFLPLSKNIHFFGIKK